MYDTRHGLPRIVNRVASIEKRKRKNGSVAHLVRWTDPDSKQRMSQLMQDEESAVLLLTLLRAHGEKVGDALDGAKEYFRGRYTVTQMIEDHIALLTNVNGYTIRRYKGNLRCHISDGLGQMKAADVEHRDVVTWVKEMKAKGLSPKTIKNVHGLLSASFKSLVRDKKRADNPCEGVSMPKDEKTEEAATFLTHDEWERVVRELRDPYRTFFTFLVRTGLRFSEATALEARDFVTTPSGQHVVKVARAWTRDEDNNAYIGPPKTKKSKRSVALGSSARADVFGIVSAATKSGGFVFLNTVGEHIDHRRAWSAWDRAVMKAQAKGLTKRPRIHDLRHTNASWLLQAGLDIYKLQQHLGHESITTTLDRYSHLLPEGLRDTAAAMDRAFGARSA